MPLSISSRPRRRGQALLFIMMALAILFFMVLWGADLHRFISVKDRSQNAGDAATLAAARWQATSLNLMGELNLLHVLALVANDDASVDLITNTQSRLCYTGPMTGFAASQQAAKLNGIPVNDAFTDFVRERSSIVRKGYAGTFGTGTSAFEEPYENAWAEYANMIDAVADEGIAAGPDNAVFYSDYSGSHTLLDEGFYNAIAGRTWCWFFFHAPRLLSSYTGYTWWPALPEPIHPHYSNSEFFSLRLSPTIRELHSIVREDVLHPIAEEAGHPFTRPTTNVWNRAGQMWFAYNGVEWGPWQSLDDPFPVEGDVRDEYNYEGADAVVRVETVVERFSPGRAPSGETGDGIVWTAAGKPFGYLEPEGVKTIPNAYGLVIPAFRDVRLMPIDASTGGSGGSFKMSWRRHISEHLEPYVRGGISACRADCWYCRRLVTWENEAFRRTGATWLEKNSDRCKITPGGGGGGGHGGSQHAH